MSNKTGGPAFPQSGVCTPEINSWDSEDFGGRGLTVRDYFAAEAMHGYISTAGGPCIIGGLDGAEDELDALKDEVRRPLTEWEVRHRLELLYGDVPRIELFSRSAAPGWHHWGNQCATAAVELLPGCAIDVVKTEAA